MKSMCGGGRVEKGGFWTNLMEVYMYEE